jgi:hypothetical protein
MNFRHKYLVNTIRILLGIFLLFSGVTGFMAGFNNFEGIPAPMLDNTKMLWDTGIFQMIKTTEIVVGLMLIFNFLPWLALLAVAPLAVGIVVVNGRTAPAYLPAGLLVGLLAVFLGYAYWNKYKQLFDRKHEV